jgi:hypothetical protein
VRKTYDRDAEDDGKGSAESEPSGIPVEGVFFQKNRHAGKCEIWNICQSGGKVCREEYLHPARPAPHPA